MTNNEARKYFKEKGLNYLILNSKSNREKLMELIKEELRNYKNKSHPDFEMKLLMVRKKDIGSYGGVIPFCLRVKGTIGKGKDKFTHFKEREAITFNRDGFIGFAGWADLSNVKPFLSAFIKWCDKMEF